MQDQQRRWLELLSAIEGYAFGAGADGLAYLEGKTDDAPSTSSADEVVAMAKRYGFDLSLAVKSLREARHQRQSDDHREATRLSGL